MRIKKSLFIILCLFLFSQVGIASDSYVVQTTSEPATLYHWFNAEKLPKQHFSAKLKPSDAKGFNYISSAQLPLWITASSNPVNLRQQGGSEENWILIELTVRSGFKVFNATPDFLFSKGCPVLTAKSSFLPPVCLKSLEDTVTALGVDALRLKSGDILLTNGKFFHPDEIKIFNRLSTDAEEERLKIQSLFYKADFDRFKLGISDSLFPSEINRLNPPFSGGGRGLLWDDLDGKPLDLHGQPSRALSDENTEKQSH